MYSHDTGSDSIDTDTIFGLLLSQTTGESYDGALGRSVVEESGIAHVGRDRSAVDNAVTALHVLESVLGHSKHGNDVSLEGLLCHVKVNLGNVEAHLLHSGCRIC
jgi:hypothetical protein